MNFLKQRFDVIKQAANQSPASTINYRVEKLIELRAELVFNIPQLVAALSDDYGHRSAEDTLVADIVPCLSHIDYTLEHLDEWASPSIRDAGKLLEMTSEVEVIYQPKGVVGIITPWNFPILLSIEPLIAAFSAGNRAMIKLSEFTPRLNTALQNVLAKVFNETEVVVVEGEAQIGAEFSALPFDHLFFTGSPRVGKLVMKSAADNLTPVTLELGGKSPVIVDSKVSISMAVERIICGKSLNSGQVCVAPDYVLLPEGKEQEFITEYQAQFSVLYPEGIDSPQWTSIINSQQFERQFALLHSEIDQGKWVVSAHSNAINKAEHRMVTHLVINPELTSTVMQEEIFGPILPIITYRELDDALAIISSKDKPLALYLMSEDQELQERIKQTMHSGGMCINDSIFHIAADDAPFGGIGGSGMGHYHGKEGFLTFSHAKTVLKTGKVHNMKSLFVSGDNDLKSAIKAHFNF
ncbi:aldehyde dehydrogenase family protein [Shewanella gelidimarina]|uniref:aldehyde dehydrogenase family protein n=1 Tax=Shewanella gelidimarina TaxID=56813 RepID=UPI00201053E0|nr:aldehyde dehydrogenase family protein [Shewanella gelidimarina]MCL1060197.1 aldehyde dehydrogenase family protein [Shewanella gelidimarina]